MALKKNIGSPKKLSPSVLEEQGGEARKLDAKSRVIELTRVVDLRRIIRYNLNSKPDNEFIFRKKEPITPIKSPIKALPKQQINDDDIGVANEFSSDEERIETDFKRRSVTRSGKSFISPIYGGHNQRDERQTLCSERPRSISTFISATRDIFPAKKQQKRYLRVTPFENNQRKVTSGPPQCKGDYNDSSDLYGGTKEGTVGKIQSLTFNSVTKEGPKVISSDREVSSFTDKLYPSSTIGILSTDKISEVFHRSSTASEEALTNLFSRAKELLAKKNIGDYSTPENNKRFDI